MNATLGTAGWSRLPHDLLHLVAAKLVRISDYIRFRSVCKSWRSAATPANLRPQPPLLMLPYHPFTHARSFFSLSTGKVHALSLAESYGKIVLNSAHGWSVMLDITTAALCLLNPITGAQIDLPSTADFYRLRAARVSPDLRNYEVTDHKGRRDKLGFNMSFVVYPWEVFLPTNPSSTGNDEGCFVFISILHSRDVIYCTPGDKAWTTLEDVLEARAWSMAHREGRLYVLDGHRNLYMFDMADPSRPPAPLLTVTVPLGLAPLFSLACTTSRELLLVTCNPRDAHGDGPHEDDDGEFFQAFRVDVRGDSPEWSEVESVGERAVFWTERQCWLVDVGDFHGCREGCVYLWGARGGRRGGGRARAGVHRIEAFRRDGGGFEALLQWEGSPSSDAMLPLWVTTNLR
ncbi:F-Box protein [Musa troglodytarum]|uniref:F-Box protein n=1 Tax=Musa troglodytarum TaxID=320322 RepID=A0A9E7G347_9LILI|nr:F-Box protein [Musa troglodytarum]